MLKRLLQTAAASALLLTTACSHMVMNTPKPTLENTQRLRGSNMAPANVGSFVLDSKLDAGRDKSVSMRGANSLTAPTDGSFALYLKETLATELRAAGLLDSNSDVVISGAVTGIELDPAISTGTGSLKARFVVKRAGAIRYDKEVQTSSSWESSFMGPVAVPLAGGQFEGLFRKLVGQLLDDPAFQAAVSR